MVGVRFSQKKKSVMNLRYAVKMLATSLCQQDWNRLEVQHHLSARLPGRLQKLAPQVADALMAQFPGGVAPDPRRLAAFMTAAPETGRIWAFIRKTGLQPSPPLTSPRFLPHPALADLGLPPLTSTDALADWLGITPAELVRFADLRGLSALSDSHFGAHYRHHLHPKSSGRLRLIEEPKPFLKRLQRQILRRMLDVVPPHDAATGFRKGTSCITGAARHAGEQIVLSFDLMDFFPSITSSRIYSLFRTLGYPRAPARALTGLCTAITPPVVLRAEGLAARDHLTQRHLPQGAPTSPALANLAAHALDARLFGLARALGATYTRYADDLTFSGDRHIAGILHRAVPDIVTGEGFQLNPAKTRAALSHQRQTVTGIVVNQRINTPRQDFDRLKAILHHLADPADPRRSDPACLARLSGQIDWHEQLNPARGLKLRQCLARALNPH